jgi:hypothetical protein
LQEPSKASRAGQGAMVLFQVGTKRGEAGGELPVAKHRRIVE